MGVIQNATDRYLHTTNGARNERCTDDKLFLRNYQTKNVQRLDWSSDDRQKVHAAQKLEPNSTKTQLGLNRSLRSAVLAIFCSTKTRAKKRIIQWTRSSFLNDERRLNRATGLVDRSAPEHKNVAADKRNNLYIRAAWRPTWHLARSTIGGTTPESGEL